jgi:hypothetical protein
MIKHLPLDEKDLVYDWVDKWMELGLLIIDVTGSDEPPISPLPPSFNDELKYQGIRQWFLEHQEQLLPIFHRFLDDSYIKTADNNNIKLEEDINDGDQALPYKYQDNLFLLFYEPENLYRLAKELGLQSGIEIWDPSEREAGFVRSTVIWISKKMVEFTDWVDIAYGNCNQSNKADLNSR